MPLPEDRKKQLAGIIKQMKAKNEPKKRIQQMVNSFKTQFGEYEQNVALQQKYQKIEGLRGQARDMARDRPQRTLQAQREDYKDIPISQRGDIGLGAWAARTPILKQLGELLAGQKITPEDIELHRQVSQGDLMTGIGELAPELAGMGAAGMKLAQAGRLKNLPAALRNMAIGGVEGAGSAGFHQLQNLQSGRGVQPLEAAIETFGSMALPGIATGAGAVTKKMAPSVLRSSIKPPRKMMDKVNPPKFDVPLEKGMVENFGGLEAVQYNTQKTVKNLAEQRDQLIRDQDLTINITNANRKVGRKLNDMVKKSEIDLEDAEKAYKYSAKEIRSAERVPSAKRDIKKLPPTLKEGNVSLAYESAGPMDIKKTKDGYKVIGKRYESGILEPKKVYEKSFKTKKQAVEYAEGLRYKLPESQYETKVVKGKLKLSGEDAVARRKLADKKSKFNPFMDATKTKEEVVYNEAYRRVLEDEIEREMGKKSGQVATNQYKNLKRDMANLIPFQKSVEFRLGQMGNNYEFGLLDINAMGLGSLLGGGLSFPAQAGTAMGVGAFRRLTARPGGASILYKGGGALQTPSIPKSIAAQTGRSLYGGNE